jgi:hypothetical protein
MRRVKDKKRWRRLEHVEHQRRTRSTSPWLARMEMGMETAELKEANL